MHRTMADRFTYADTRNLSPQVEYKKFEDSPLETTEGIRLTRKVSDIEASLL